MAFTETQKLDIVRTTGIPKFDLDWHLNYYSAGISAEAEAKVLAEIQTWDDNDLDTDYTQLAPNVANYGIRDDPENLRQAISANILLYLGIDASMVGAGSTKYLERA